MNRQYRQTMNQRAKQFRIYENLRQKVGPDSALMIQCLSTLEELDLTLNAWENAGRKQIAKLFDFNECEQCGRDYRDHGCTHNRVEFNRDDTNV